MNSQRVAHIMMVTMVNRSSTLDQNIVCACGRGRLRSHAVRTSGVGSIAKLRHQEKARNCMVWSWFGPTTCKIDFTLGFCM
jgi:hypothetical protein